MSEENVNLVRAMYAAFGSGNIPGVLAGFDPQVEWWEAENFIYAEKNPYVGPNEVLSGVFMLLGDEWDGFAVSPKRFLDAGETVVAEGITVALTKRPNPFALSLHTFLLSATAS